MHLQAVLILFVRFVDVSKLGARLIYELTYCDMVNRQGTEGCVPFVALGGGDEVQGHLVAWA